MKRKLNIILVFIFLLLTISCETKNITTEPVVEAIKPTISFDERRFIYNNGIEVEYKNIVTTDGKKVEIRNNYPIISGLKDKSIQDKINNEIVEVGKTLLSQLEADLLKASKNNTISYSMKNSNAYITYNFNNVIFVEYSVYIEAQLKTEKYYPMYKIVSYGYDLNIGERIELAEIFKPGSDYKSKINNFICQYIIENNYDDYEAEKMTKPFQGIRENQSYTLDMWGLRIILDEKNDEFVNCGYSEQVLIPLKYLGDELYFFDRYVDEGKNIYEKEKLSKKLFPNKLEFKVNNIIQEGNEKYYIYINQGEFINVPNEDIEKKLNGMLASSFDIEDFKERAKAYTGLNGNLYFGSYNHDVNMYINAGGYLSMATTENIYIGSTWELKKIPFNYDFNLNKEILIGDLFVDGVDIGKTIKTTIKSLNYPITDEMLEAGVAKALRSNIFNFDEYGIYICFSPEGAKLDDYQRWVTVPFEAFGIENIRILN
ncbi:MAG: hypothetical protein WBL93_10945 [Lutisporaceae bacterium]